jgi:endonuclease YncB( thermonuclease family)
MQIRIQIIEYSYSNKKNKTTGDYSKMIQDNYIRDIYKIEEVKDGDTVVAIVELGYNQLGRVTFRFKGINTAEKNSNKNSKRYKLAMEAKDFVNDKLKNHKVRVLSEKFETGGFGRYLGSMYYEENGKWYDLNKELLDRGLAQIYYKGASKDYGEF